MFDMWSSVTSKLEAQTQIQSNIQQTNLQNSSSGSIKGERKDILLLNNEKQQLTCVTQMKRI
jgi:hypothetical protein